MNDVIAFAFENRAQPDAGCQVDGVADAQRMASYARGDGPVPEPSRGIANQFRAMTGAGQLKRQAKHLGLAPGEAKFGIDAGDAQRQGVSRVAIGRHLDGVVRLNCLHHITV